MSGPLNTYFGSSHHHDPAVMALTGIRPKNNQVNLAGDPKYADKLAEMEAPLLSEQLRTGDPYRLWNQPAMEIRN